MKRLPFLFGLGLILLDGLNVFGQSFLGVDPGSGVSGDTILLQADGLDLEADYTLSVGEVPVVSPAVSEDGIRFVIPEGLASGLIELTVDGAPVNTGQVLQVVRTLTGTLDLPGALSGTGYIVGSFPDFDLDADSNNSTFMTKVLVSGVQVLMAFREESDPAFLGVVTSADDTVVINAESTALGLAFMNPALLGISDADAQSLITNLKGDSALLALAALIESKSGLGQDYLEDVEVEAAWSTLNDVALGLLQTQDSPAVSASDGTIVFKSDSPSNTYILDIDEGLSTDRSTTVELTRLKNNTGFKVGMKEIREGAVPSNWQLELWELDPGQFERGFDDILRNHQGTTFTSRRLTNIDTGFLPASLAGKKLDILDQLTGMVADKILAPADPAKGPNEFFIGQQPGIYEVRGYSGNLWYGYDAGFISTESQWNMIQALDVNNARIWARSSNIVFGCTDLLKILIKPGDFLRKSRVNPTTGKETVSKLSDDFEGFMTDFFYHAQKRVLAAETANADTDFWYDLLKDFAGDFLTYAANSILEQISEAEGVTGKLRVFAGKAAALAKNAFDIFGKTGNIINIGQRFAGVVGPTSLAFERTLVVVGDPFEPQIQSYYPQRGREGDLIRVYGNFFGDDSSALTVAFCNINETQVRDPSNATPPPTTLRVEAKIEQLISDKVMIISVPEGMAELDQEKIYLCIEKTQSRYTSTRFNPNERFRTFDYVDKPVIESIDTSPVYTGGYVTLRGKDMRLERTDVASVTLYIPAETDGGEPSFSQTITNLVRSTDTEVTFRAPNFNRDYLVGYSVNGVESETKIPLTVELREAADGDPPVKLIPFVTSLSWTDDPDDPEVTILEALKMVAGNRVPTQHLPGERIPEGEVGHIPPTPRETDNVAGDAQYVGDPVTSPVTTNEIRLSATIRNGLLDDSLDPTIMVTSAIPLASHTSYTFSAGKSFIFDFSGYSGDGFVFDQVSGSTIDSLIIKNVSGDALKFTNNSSDNVITKVEIDTASGSGMVFSTDSDNNQFGVYPGLSLGQFTSTISKAMVDGIRFEGGASDNDFIDFQITDAGQHGVHFFSSAFRNRFRILKILNPGANGLELNGDLVRSNVVEGFYTRQLHTFIENAGGIGIQITNGASGNYLNPGRIFNSTTGGIFITGENTLGNLIGDVGPNSFDMRPEVLEQAAGYGIKIEGGAQRNEIRRTNVGGLNEDAIIISGSETKFNVIEEVELGYAYYLFEDGTGDVIVANDLDQIRAPIAKHGIKLTDGASYNQIHDLTTWEIALAGVLIEGEGTEHNTLTGSDLRGGIYALQIADGPKFNRIGGLERGQDSNLILSGTQNTARVMVEGTGTEENEFIGNDLTWAPFGGIVIGGPPSKEYTTGIIGIHIRNGAAGNIIGRPGAPSREENLDNAFQPFAFYPGNEFAGSFGIVLENAGGTLGSNGELIKPNIIQNNVFGSVYFSDVDLSFGNGTDVGIQIKGNAEGNIIGGPNPEEGNFIQSSVGIEILNNVISEPALRNRISNNIIGFNFSGDGFPGWFSDFDDPCDLPPRVDDVGFSLWDVAVYIRGEQSRGNVIGESILAPNQIRNMAIGVFIEDGATGNLVRGNEIFGNELSGIVLKGSDGNTIGGPTPNERNHIFNNGNEPDGSQIRANLILCDSDTNLVQNNRIGLDVSDGIGQYNLSSGVLLLNAADNLIGGDSLVGGNWIGGHADDGIRIEGSDTSGNLIRSNQIGTLPGGGNAANGGDGIELLDGPFNNGIGVRQRVPLASARGSIVVPMPNFIYFNTGAGVAVGGEASAGNQILNNSINGNGGKGIDLQGVGNNNQAAPTVEFGSPFLISGGVPDLETIPPGSLVQVFGDNDITQPEGSILIGSGLVRNGGSWIVFPVQDPTGLVLSVTATHATTDDTSEFAAVGELAQPLLFEVARADGEQPSDVSATFDNDGNLAVLPLSIKAGATPVQVNSLILRADGSASDPIVIDGVCLYEDTDGSGTYSAGDAILAGPELFAIDNGRVRLTPDPAITLEAEASSTYFIVYKRQNTFGQGQTFSIGLLLAANVDAVNLSPGSGPATPNGNFPIRSDVFTISEELGNTGPFDITVSSGEGGSATGGGSYDFNATAELVAIPDDGFRFTGWSGDIQSRDNPLSIQVQGTLSITANFAEEPRSLRRGDAELENDFKYVDGFGLMWMTFYPWVFHTELGWIYLVEADEESLWIFSPDLGWLWTQPRVYPYFFRLSDRSFLYLYEEESSLPNGRYFYNFTTEEIEGPL